MKGTENFRMSSFFVMILPKSGELIAHFDKI